MVNERHAIAGTKILIPGMRLFLWLFSALGLSVLTCAAQIPGSNSLPGKACGPQEYCARSDRRVEPYPDKPPGIGPSGSIISDPTFGSRILRVTDGRSDPVQAGRPLFTPASAEQNSWNKDSTMFYVNTSGGSLLLYDFDPATITARQAGTPKRDLGGEPEFSFLRANILYGMNRRERVLEQYDTSSGRVADINDPSKCVKLGSGDSGYLTSVARTTVGLWSCWDRNRIGTIWFTFTIGPRGAAGITHRPGKLVASGDPKARSPFRTAFPYITLAWRNPGSSFT